VLVGLAYLLLGYRGIRGGIIMGFSGISPLSLLLILAIVVVIFGTNRLKSIGHDVGSAIKSFRRGVQDEQNDQDKE